ncbi:hypothetical protein JCM3775_006300 [Rhodotorula graminis]
MPSTATHDHTHAHDFKTPGGLLHLQATIFWTVLPEICIFVGWAFLIASLSETVHQLEIAPTLLTVFGTVIGLLLTFKTNSAFGSYSEGRRLWSSVILASRTFARMAWLHCPDQLHVPADPSTSISHAERAEALAEKRTYINLVAAFSVALKHYVRGEPGVHYTDLWPLVAFLPRYHKLPSSLYLRRDDLGPGYAPSPVEPGSVETLGASAFAVLGGPGAGAGARTPLAMSRQTSFDPAFELHGGLAAASSQSMHSLSEAHSRTPLFPPLSSTSPVQPRTASPSVSGAAATAEPSYPRAHAHPYTAAEVDLAAVAATLRDRRGLGLGEVKKRRSTAALAMAVERAAPGQGHELLPARNPPPRSIDDFVPFYDFFADVLHWLFRRGRGVAHKIEDAAHRLEGDDDESGAASRSGRRRRRMRREKGKKEPLQTREGGDNVPLELILLLSGWVAALQRRKTIDVPTINALLGALQALSDALTGLERVLLTPMPIAYSLHLRHVIWIYLLLAPSQLHETLGWLTVPATAIISFVFLGLLRLGDQIENPLGYDPSDLDLESFTLTVLRELRELVAHPAGESAPDEVLAALREGAKKAAAVEAAGKEGEEGEGKDGEGEGEQGSEGGKEERLVEEEERREYGEEGWRRV